MNDTLKAVGNIGAELAAAKAELQREMERHRKTWRQLEQVKNAMRRIVERCEIFIDDEAEMSTASVEALMGIAEDALSQQAEPAAVNQCDGCQAGAPVDNNGNHRMGKPGGYADLMRCEKARYVSEPAPAQDERKTFEVEIPDISAIYDGRSFIPYRSLEAGERLMTVAQHLRIEKRLRAALTRPAQTEQQPVAWVEVKDRHEGPYQFHGLELLDSGKHNLYAAPIAQTALSAVTAERDRLLSDNASLRGSCKALGEENKQLKRENKRQSRTIATLAAKEA